MSESEFQARMASRAQAGRPSGEDCDGSHRLAATDQWVRRINQLGRAMDKRARERAVLPATREAITRRARARFRRFAAKGPA